MRSVLPPTSERIAKLILCSALSLCLYIMIMHPSSVSSQHDLDVDEHGLPPVMRCTGQKLLESGLYIVGEWKVVDG